MENLADLQRALTHMLYYEKHSREGKIRGNRKMNELDKFCLTQTHRHTYLTFVDEPKLDCSNFL